MNKLIGLFILIISAQMTFAAEEECPPAAEMAEAQNQNLYKNCDYSDKGLNGVLHRALGKKKDNADEETIQEVKPAVKAVQEKSTKVADVELKKPDEFSSAAQLQLVKFNALEKLSRECAKGFVVEGERYLPVANTKSLKLELIYHCL